MKLGNPIKTCESCSFLSLVSERDGDAGLGKDPLLVYELIDGEFGGTLPLPSCGPSPGDADLLTVESLKTSRPPFRN